MAMASSRSPTDDHVVGRRVREVYRYFQPGRSCFPDPIHGAPGDDTVSHPIPAAGDLGPPSPSLSGQLATTTHSLLSEALVLGENNATLTSFAQLAALRLDVERVLISVSDRTSQYIIAQSSKSSPDVKKAYESAADGIWDGCHRIPYGAWSMCKATLDLPPSNRDRGEYSFFEIDDLSKDNRYKNLPFVKDEPHFRFYAGMPLTTETNINIGCFFLLDTEPRKGLTEAQREAFGSLSILIMNFLKVSRQASEGRRAARLSRGLSCFVEGSSSFVDSVHPLSYAGSSAPPSSTPPSSWQRGTYLSVDSMNASEMPSRRSHSSDARSSSSVSDYKVEPGSSSSPPTPIPELWSRSRRKELQRLEQSHGNSWAFRRAANLIRESLELDGNGGVVFLEVGHYSASDVDSGSEFSDDHLHPASVLAISTNDEPFAPEPGSTALCPAANLDNGFLQQLIRRYSRGRLWSFHRDGMLSSSDDEKSKFPRSRARTVKPQELAKSGSKKWKSIENTLLNRYFPNATQVMFVPLWNAAGSQWFAGCFCWSTVETRVFSSSVELSSVLGFGSSIMAEHSRLESLISDQQKGDFIGSISHELRSPLHGILAAAEFLNGTNLDEFQGSLLETINACGRTLLDTMNQVLDFSKIVSLERKSRHLRHKGRHSNLDDKDKVSAHLDTYVTTNLAQLAEEVVEGVCLGHAYSLKSPSFNYMGPACEMRRVGNVNQPLAPMDVEVTVDIAQNDWIYHTQPGALRRIIMNLFGNAMKYTEAGHVGLHLEVTESSDGRRRSVAEDLVTLTVSDTGKGISEEFLRGRLYTPFAQEDTLAVGTGLGLSIVKSLVKAMKGGINIHSRPGEGTVVKVTLPLTRPGADTENIEPRCQSTAEEKITEDCRLLRQVHANRRAAILGMEPPDVAGHPMWSIISRYLTDWYGLELVSWPSQVPVDIFLADECTLTEFSRQGSAARLPSLLVLCSRNIDYHTAQAQWSSLANIVSITRRPCGPNKLARAIRKCLDTQVGAIPQQCLIDLPERPRRKTLPSESNTTPENKPLEVGSDNPDLTDSTTASITSKSTPSQATSDMSDPMSTALTPPSPQTSPGPPPPEAKSERRPRVLVVDDNPINLNLMLTFMKKRRLAILDSAENGKLAVDCVERLASGYDLIFMDMSMPVMNGFEATRAIRAIERERDTKLSASAIIIALTGLSSSRDESDALASGVDLFLTKPVSFKEVSKLLEEWEEKGLEHRRNTSLDQSMFQSPQQEDYTSPIDYFSTKRDTT